MANYLEIAASGRRREKASTVTSSGVAEAGDIVSLDGTGKLDPSVLPPGIGADVLNAEATEALSAGDYVNIFLDGGVAKMRLADNSNDRKADGFVNNAVLIAATENIFFEGANANLSGLTIGERYYLGVAGAPTLTAPSATGEILQFLGKAVSATSINTDIEDEIVRA